MERNRSKGVNVLALLIASLMACQAIVVVGAIDFRALNNATSMPGGKRFDREIGLAYTEQLLVTASSFIWQIFRQAPGDIKHVETVTMVLESMNGVAYTLDSGIHMSAEYIDSFSGNVTDEFTGVMYHELTHVWQWSGNGSTPSGLIEGIADYVRLRSGFVPSHWVSPGQGARWDQGYDVTARFLDYCDLLRDGFVAELNRRMRDAYSEELFVELLGETVDQLWKNYKARYGGT